MDVSDFLVEQPSPVHRVKRKMRSPGTAKHHPRYFVEPLASVMTKGGSSSGRFVATAQRTLDARCSTAPMGATRPMSKSVTTPDFGLGTLETDALDFGAAEATLAEGPSRPPTGVTSRASRTPSRPTTGTLGPLSFRPATAAAAAAEQEPVKGLSTYEAIRLRDLKLRNAVDPEERSFQCVPPPPFFLPQILSPKY